MSWSFDLAFLFLRAVHPHPERQSLVKNERPVRLGSRALEILAALVERPGEILGKSGTRSRAPGRKPLSRKAISVTVSAIRRALGGCRHRYQLYRDGERPRLSLRLAGAGLLGWEKPVPAAAMPPRAHNLPVSTTRLVGRSDAVKTALDVLAHFRLVTIVGPGGIGKTRLALAAADELDRRVNTASGSSIWHG